MNKIGQILVKITTITVIFLLTISSSAASPPKLSLCAKAIAGDPSIHPNVKEAELIKASQVKYFASKGDLMNLFYLGFPQTSKIGTWMARAKDPKSMAAKLGKIKREKQITNPGFQFTSFKQISKHISDGLGGRLIIDHPSKANMNIFVSELLEQLEQGELSILRIENYWGEVDGVPYLNKKQMKRIRKKIKSLGEKPPPLITGKDAQKSSGYTSLHLDIRLKNGTKVELQVRGRVLQQLAEVSHLFYDHLSGKPPGKVVTTNPSGLSALNLIKELNPSEQQLYKKYLASGYRFIREYMTDNRKAIMVDFPLEAKYGELELGALAKSYGYQRLTDLITSPSSYNPQKPDYLMFGSSRLLVAGLPNIFETIQTQENLFSLEKLNQYNIGLPVSILRDVIGNVAQGSMRFLSWESIRDQFYQVHEMVSGLNYIAVIAWEEHKMLEKRRAVLRGGKKWSVPVNLPAKHDPKQVPGPSQLFVGEIHFMQDSGNNSTGSYTVVNNAHAIKKGQLDPTDTSIFPPIQVWRDSNGKVWTLDHRRLISLNLAQWRKTIPVEFVTADKVDEDRFKYTNASNGRSVILHFDELPGYEGESPMAIVVRKIAGPQDLN